MSPILILIPVLTIVLAIKKVPSFLALLAGTIAGIIAAFIAQPQFSIGTILNSMATGFSGEFTNEMVGTLFNRGGISSKMTTVSLSLLCLAFGELLQQMGVLTTILDRLEVLVRKPGPLVITTLFTCLLTVILTASQYVAIKLPGEIFKESYKKADVAPYVLSRTLEDGRHHLLLPGSLVHGGHLHLGRAGGSHHRIPSLLFLPICVPFSPSSWRSPGSRCLRPTALP